ncbi:putative ornithine aminotransferase RocD1 and RocD2 [Roseibium sp. TrichSKD4]|uniref:hypothetical protein n=1 Tax=Roseibium sp. TrichSKD4 TaxID=744980 RepID=UPI0001E5732D|nr:hypothetical protein [Roseibium sp. TrichSKD4]EFO29133.1 putative ornithine aminotransferase RocD1 and RocD2 [Roseibium sp. TrichSKD4]
MIDMENIISGAAKGGWDWFDQVDDKAKAALKLDQEKAAEDRSAIARAWADFAATPGGEKALEALFDSTLRRTVFFVSLGLDMQSMAAFGAFREGQNSVAHLIAKAIAEGRGENTKPREV